MPINPSALTPLQLKLERIPIEDGIVVKCSGRLIAENSVQFKADVKSMIPHHKRIALDLSELTQMDSSGLGALVAVYISARTGSCDLRLIQLNQRIRELLGITNLLSIFEACGQHNVKLP